MQAPPPAWAKETRRRQGRRSAAADGEDQGLPELDFDSQFAATVIGSFPVEFWCQAAQYRDRFLAYLDELIRWTAERLFPAWADKKERTQHSAQIFEWIRTLSGLIGRVLPFVTADEMIARYIAPFSREAGEDALKILDDITDKVVCRHVYDAPTVADPTLAVLQHCLQRMLQERVFDKGHWGAGEIRDRSLHSMVRSLLFVFVENAPGAARFANGDWSDLQVVLPLIDALMEHAGWSVSVMQTYLTLCERAGPAFPIDTFIRHISALLDAEGNYPAKWSGTNIAARLSGMVQILAEANHPLTGSHARELLIILDRLVDTGDRRAAALQQSEHFRGVQLGT